jgi:lipoprotein-releasing system ATP-binding protein
MVGIKGLGKAFGAEVILDGADFAADRGEAVALVGPSGSGKSTLLYIMGLLDSADQGVVTIDGARADDMGDDQRSALRLAKIGFVYQQHNLFADFTALENAMIPLLMAGASMREAGARARECLAALGLEKKASAKAVELSGGEAQRTAIARAIVLRPKILLADEPTGNLDPKNGEMVFDLLLEMVRREKMTAVVATHNPLLAKRLDRTVSIVDGRIKPSAL